MIQEVSLTRLEAFPGPHLAPEPHLAMVTASMLAGNTAARLWEVRQAANEAVLLLWDQGNKVFYLAGAVGSDATTQELTTLLTTVIRPQALAAGVNYFKVQALSPALTAALPTLFAWCQLREAQDWFYGFVQSAPNVITPPAVADLHFLPINQAFLQNDTLANIDPIRDEVRWMWPSLERFYRHGFGVAAVIPGRAICWCTAEYVSPTRCGIGITTDEAYQGRGVATATTAHFVQRCQQQGITPYWQCGSWNAASRRVAEKVGFAKLDEEQLWVGAFAK